MKPIFSPWTQRKHNIFRATLKLHLYISVQPHQNGFLWNLFDQFSYYPIATSSVFKTIEEAKSDADNYLLSQNYLLSSKKTFYLL